MADGYVVDTDVISYLFRHGTRAELYRPYLTDSIPAVSFMTVAELDRWALERNWGMTRQQRMASFLEQLIHHPCRPLALPHMGSNHRSSTPKGTTDPDGGRMDRGQRDLAWRALTHP